MYPAPTLAKLADTQRESFKLILTGLAETKFDRHSIEAKWPELVSWMTSILTTDEDQRRMCNELDEWVRWYRLFGYYLTSLLQEALRGL